MKLSVVIVAYKNSKVLLKCLNSINKYNDLGDALEVIIVDNSPDDEKIENDLKFSEYHHYIYIPADNKGFGAGNNIGAKVAKGEIIAFINPDIILIEPIFKTVYERFNVDERLALFGGKLFCEDMTPTFSFYYDYRFSIIKKWSIKLWNKLDRFNEKSMFISGANLFIRKKVFFDIGMFDEKFFMYYEEADIIRRIKKLNPNNKVCYFKDIRMIHLEKQCTPSSLSAVGYEFDSAIYFGKKYGLDYKKKILFEYKYYKLKAAIYKFLNNEKFIKIKNIVDFLNEKYYN